MNVTASIVVSFGSGAADDAQLLAEVDGRSLSENGTNNGRTQFLPGDVVRYLVYRYKLSATTHRSSAGTVGSEGNGQRQIEETLVFSDTQEARLKYPAYTLDSFEWLGNDLGAVMLTGGSGVRAAVSGVGVAIVKYTAKFDVWRLTSPAQINGRDSFEIAIHVVGQP